MASVKIFVYGTLKVGGYYASRFDEVRDSSVDATVCGKLYGSPYGYPRLVLAPESDRFTVRGELHTYRDPEHVIKLMDHIEGYEENRTDNLYNRKIVKVRLDNGVEEEAFIYEYAQPIERGAEIIKSGIWEI